MVLGGLVYTGLTRRFAHRMLAVRQSLSGEEIEKKEELPSSGVSEIDDLCTSLSDAQHRLGL